VRITNLLSTKKHKTNKDENMPEEEKVTIRIDLTGDLAKHFLYLKKVKGIKNNSELVRLLIADEYRRTSGSPPFR